MANEKNLEAPWAKGQSGNPNGRPKGSKNRSTIAKKWLEVMGKYKNPITNEEDISVEDAITLAQIKKAMKGDSNAYKHVMDSAYGTPTSHVENTHEVKPFDIKQLYSEE